MQKELSKEGLEEYPKGLIVFGNFVIVFWLILGAVACWFFYPILGLVYLITAFILVYIVLRRLVCINCYYYDKWCGIGFGKISAIMFKKGRIEAFPTSIGLKLAPATYGLLIIVPPILLIVSIVQGFSWYKVILLFLLILVLIYTWGVGRKALCMQCKMNMICPGSGVKKKSAGEGI